MSIRDFDDVDKNMLDRVGTREEHGRDAIFGDDVVGDETLGDELVGEDQLRAEDILFSALTLGLYAPFVAERVQKKSALPEVRFDTTESDKLKKQRKSEMLRKYEEEKRLGDIRKSTLQNIQSRQIAKAPSIEYTPTATGSTAGWSLPSIVSEPSDQTVEGLDSAVDELESLIGAQTESPFDIYIKSYKTKFKEDTTRKSEAEKKMAELERRKLERLMSKSTLKAPSFEYPTTTTGKTGWTVSISPEKLDTSIFNTPEPQPVAQSVLQPEASYQEAQFEDPDAVLGFYESGGHEEIDDVEVDDMNPLVSNIETLFGDTQMAVNPTVDTEAKARAAGFETRAGKDGYSCCPSCGCCLSFSPLPAGYQDDLLGDDGFGFTEIVGKVCIESPSYDVIGEQAKILNAESGASSTRPVAASPTGSCVCYCPCCESPMCLEGFAPQTLMAKAAPEKASSYISGIDAICGLDEIDVLGATRSGKTGRRLPLPKPDKETKGKGKGKTVGKGKDKPSVAVTTIERSLKSAGRAGRIGTIADNKAKSYKPNKHRTVVPGRIVRNVGTTVKGDIIGLDIEYVTTRNGVVIGATGNIGFKPDKPLTPKQKEAVKKHTNALLKTQNIVQDAKKKAAKAIVASRALKKVIVDSKDKLLKGSSKKAQQKVAGKTTVLGDDGFGFTEIVGVDRTDYNKIITSIFGDDAFGYTQIIGDDNGFVEIVGDILNEEILGQEDTDAVSDPTADTSTSAGTADTTGDPEIDKLVAELEAESSQGWTAPVRGKALSEADAAQSWADPPEDAIIYDGRSGWPKASLGSYNYWYGKNPAGKVDNNGAYNNGYVFDWDEFAPFSSAKDWKGWIRPRSKGLPRGDSWDWPAAGRLKNPDGEDAKRINSESIAAGLGPLIGDPGNSITKGLQFAANTGQWFWRGENAPAAVTAEADAAAKAAWQKKIEADKAAKEAAEAARAQKQAEQEEEQARLDAEIAMATSKAEAEDKIERLAIEREKEKLAAQKDAEQTKRDLELQDLEMAAVKKIISEGLPPPPAGEEGGEGEGEGDIDYGPFDDLQQQAPMFSEPENIDWGE